MKIEVYDISMQELNRLKEEHSKLPGNTTFEEYLHNKLTMDREAMTKMFAAGLVEEMLKLKDNPEVQKKLVEAVKSMMEGNAESSAKKWMEEKNKDK